MTLSAHTISAKAGTKKTRKRVGRGNSSGKGTYSSRGLKGQRSRSGGKGGNQLRSFRQSLLKVPKVRGFKSLNSKAQTVALATLERIAVEGKEITPVFLKKAKVIKDTGKPIKIVATGEIKKKLVISGCLSTKKAMEMIEKVGGSFKF
ncbi:MAG: 50S ribosomal protein L15 [Candidatus Magasanikbacteria bacterium CG_4_10_14_0_2_um_filter_37_12]|uniref:Large ribosomal subunit protein uL15 n=1 Tax=Candidatus Magasanikbacteria bacterium CG_4_10_14_0_2_um_filter_37_12 TaxID=1974637 RepID=A0A2M7V8M5_9BACT|nr:MAG: 50S ribosomal protein L15 [Candidatus Magasanikbacteria bacterium CG_4_10_14_0_2_um_filter_37_12]